MAPGTSRQNDIPKLNIADRVVYQLAANAGLPVVERRASQMTEGDLVGLPSVEGNRTSFNPPDWFKQACEEPVCLFLDEVDQDSRVQHPPKCRCLGENAFQHR